MIPPIVISAAGRGTRMKELAQSIPKHLINVSGRPFLTYLLDNLYAAGFKQVYLVVGHHAEAAYQFVAEYKQTYPVQVINQFERLGEEHYGTLMPLLAVEPELKGQSVVAVNGDNLYSSYDLQRFLHSFQASVVVGMEHESPERYGVLVPKVDGSLEKIVEKPAVPPSRLVNTGLYGFSPLVWQVLSEVELSPRGEYEITDAVSLLAQREKVGIFRLQDYWLDFGRPEDIAAVEAVVTAGRQE